MVSRRAFFSRIFAGVAAAVVAPKVLAANTPVVERTPAIAIRYIPLYDIEVGPVLRTDLEYFSGEQWSDAEVHRYMASKRAERDALRAKPVWICDSRNPARGEWWPPR
jgi:hypothetical protein